MPLMKPYLIILAHHKAYSAFLGIIDIHFLKFFNGVKRFLQKSKTYHAT